MNSFRVSIFRIIFISILMVTFPLFADQTETIEKEHLKFYKAGETIPVGQLLGLDRITGKNLVSITIHYNMIRSKLSGEWVPDENSQGVIKLRRGLKKEVTGLFGIKLPAEPELQLTGRKGQIQVRSLSAVIKPVKMIMADPVIPVKKLKKVSRLAKLKRIAVKEQSLDILNPGGGENFLLGSKVEIQWQMRGMKRGISGELWKGKRKVKVLFEKWPGKKGGFVWKLRGKYLKPGGNYRIRLRTMGKRYSSESGFFSISQHFSKLKVLNYIKPISNKELQLMKEKDPISVQVLRPRSNAQWEIFRNYQIRWKSKGLKRDDKIAIALKSKTAPLAKIVAITENTGVYNYNVPYPVGIFGDDVRVIIAPLKDRSIEVLSNRFSINKPDVDLVCYSPKIEIEVKRKKRKTKWWQRLGDVFSGGITYSVRKYVDLLLLRKSVLHINFSVFNNGTSNLRNVDIACTIVTRQGYPEYEFSSKLIPRMYGSNKYSEEFVVDLSKTGLKKGDYIIEIWLDPFKDQGESDRLRKNNRIAVDFPVK